MQYELPHVPTAAGRTARLTGRRRHTRRSVAAALLLVQALILAVVLGLRLVGALGGDAPPVGRDVTEDRPSAVAGEGVGGVIETRPVERSGSGERATQPPPPPPVPYLLQVTTHPEGAAIEVTGGDGRAISGVAPYTGQVMSGDVSLTVTMDGHNTLTKEIALDEATTLDLWLDPAGLLHHKVGELETGSSPKQVAFSPDNSQIWVTPLGEPGIEVFDATTLERLAEIPSGEHGTVEVIFNADGSKAYASQMQTASVFEIDTETFEVERQLFTGSAWSKIMALTPDEQTLFVANWSGNNVTEIDLGTGIVRRQIPSVATPRGLYITPDGERMFVAGFDGGEIQRITLATGDSEVVLRTGGAMRHMVANAEGTLLYADDMGTDEVYVVDLVTEEARKLADTQDHPNTIDITPDGKILYVSNRGRNGENYYLPGPEWGSVLVLDAATGRPLDGIVGGNQPTGLDVSPDGAFMAYSDFLDNRVSIYEIPDYRVLADGGGGRYEQMVAEIPKG